MRGYQKYARNWILTMAFWATCKIAQPNQPIWQHIFALPWSALKKPPWEFNFFHIFGIPLSSRHAKRCQMLERLFVLFHRSRNIPCDGIADNLVLLSLSKSLINTLQWTSNAQCGCMHLRQKFCFWIPLTLVTQPMLQPTLNQTELRLMVSKFFFNVDSKNVREKFLLH